MRLSVHALPSVVFFKVLSLDIKIFEFQHIVFFELTLSQFSRYLFHFQTFLDNTHNF